MPATITPNPPPTPARGIRLVTFRVGDLAREVRDAIPAPLPSPAELFHDQACAVCLDAGLASDNAAEFVAALADEIAGEVVDPVVEFEDPPLTPGEKRVFDGERARLFRMLDARTAAKNAAVLELIDDMAQQAPAVDAVIAAETERRRETAQARPTLALALGRNRGES